MGTLIGLSAFFSASEAALFYLRLDERRGLAAGRRASRTAAGLLEAPDRLLSAVLFWNLVVNMAYFAAVSIVGSQLASDPAVGNSGAVTFSVTALVAIIFFAEMLPKSLAVISAPTIARLVAVPLAATVRCVDPIMPTLQMANLLSQRLLWPRFEPEQYLEVADLERAIALSTSDAELAEKERIVLGNIVSLSEIRADECMRPRTQFEMFRPPVDRRQLVGRMPPSGYLLITEPDSDEVVSAVHLENVADLPERHLEHHAEPVVYVPWCISAADAWEKMQTRGREVAVVVNEQGETIGILTFEDILDVVFAQRSSRSERLLKRESIRQVAPGRYHVTAMTSLRRIGRYFERELPPSRSVTVAGIVQETLQRIPAPGDRCRWGPFQLDVLEAPHPGALLVELTELPETREETP